MGEEAEGPRGGNAEEHQDSPSERRREGRLHHQPLQETGGPRTELGQEPREYEGRILEAVGRLDDGAVGVVEAAGGGHQEPGGQDQRVDRVQQHEGEEGNGAGGGEKKGGEVANGLELAA